MKSHLPKYYLLLLLCISGHRLYAQADIDEAGKLLSRVKQTYDSANISFHLKYTYAEADQPNTVTDSLEGDARLQGSNCFMTLGNIIFFRNQSYNISVFKEDKLIMLGRPSTLSKEMQLPSDQISTALHQAGVTACRLLRNHQLTTIIFEYSRESPCRRMEITIDEATSLIREVVTQIPQPLSPEESVTTRGSEQYIMIRTFFTAMKTEQPNDSIFNEKMFFTREGNVIKPAAAYADYQIFLASPNI
ncbi:hypothetical protein [Chitinophaga sp. sic0106]|uniref:hypothetical protein n=1 Tax=Chitinophaga sp. sic0106 TaxID=2854785 RepID=UPI001C489705|nr:hypothetical protein [Chitinophaga sp. sic0106]MBV7530985.1 hypothetical protein [Chitinophaga sp. sic0106]